MRSLALVVCLLPVSCTTTSQSGGRVVNYPTIDEMARIEAELGLNYSQKRSSKPTRTMTTDINTGRPPATYDPGFSSFDGPIKPPRPINVPETPPAPPAPLPPLEGGNPTPEIPSAPSTGPVTAPGPNTGTLQAPPLSDLTPLPGQ